MKAVKDKIRFALWLKPETMEKVRAASAQDDCGSLSEFIEKAVLAYRPPQNHQDRPQTAAADRRKETCIGDEIRINSCNVLTTHE